MASPYMALLQSGGLGQMAGMARGGAPAQRPRAMPPRRRLNAQQAAMQAAPSPDMGMAGGGGSFRAMPEMGGGRPAMMGGAGIFGPKPAGPAPMGGPAPFQRGVPRRRPNAQQRMAMEGGGGGFGGGLV